MANVKITDLTAYADPVSTDVLPVVDVTADTTKKVSIATLLKNASLGTAALPGIAFDGDPNTGLYSPGADQVAISTAGTGRLFVDSSGNISIGQLLSALQSGGTGITLYGTSYSEIKLLNSTTGSTSTDGTALLTAGNDFTINNREAGSVIIGTSNLERLRIASNGVVTVKNGAVAEIGTLTDAATITPDFAANCNFTVTLGGNRTIANPTSVTAGQSGSIFIVQDATGGRTASWGANWDWSSGAAPTLSTAANAVDRIDYVVRSATSIHAVWTGSYS